MPGPRSSRPQFKSPFTKAFPSDSQSFPFSLHAPTHRTLTFKCPLPMLSRTIPKYIHPNTLPTLLVHLVLLGLTFSIHTYTFYTMHVVYRSTVLCVMSVMQFEVMKVVHEVFNFYLHVQKMYTNSAHHFTTGLVHGNG